MLGKKLGSILKGVYARDQFPSLKTYAPACYVINTKPSNSPGEHWLAIYMRHNRTTVYFDSFGFPPDQMSIIKFLQKHTTRWTYSTKMIQNPSQWCVASIVLCFYYMFIDLKVYVIFLVCLIAT